MHNSRLLPRKRHRSKPMRTPKTIDANRCRKVFMIAPLEQMDLQTINYSGEQSSLILSVAAEPRCINPFTRRFRENLLPPQTRHETAPFELTLRPISLNGRIAVLLNLSSGNPLRR